MPKMNKKHKCPLCGKILAAGFAFNRHTEECFRNMTEGAKIRKADDVDKAYMCQCGVKFSHKKNLTYHLKWECGKLLMCFICNTKFKFKSALLSHTKKFH